ncbi:MAG: hypothetical protein K8F56_19700 [Rhodocyclaceae bacterium]|nr:hypothetical protein [Rhodocyclaceae bacterium]
MKALDPEHQADYAKYLCILVSGFVETAFEELAIEHCRRRASPTVLSFAARKLARPQNLKAEPLLRLLGSFEASWRVELEGFLAGERKDALDSLVDLRNKIAHGDTVTVSLIAVKRYYKAVREVVEFIENRFA